MKSLKTSQVLFGFASFCSVIGPENSHHPVNQSDLKANRDLDNGVCPRSRHCHLTQILTEFWFLGWLLQRWSTNFKRCAWKVSKMRRKNRATANLSRVRGILWHHLRIISWIKQFPVLLFLFVFLARPCFRPARFLRCLSIEIVQDHSSHERPKSYLQQ